MVYHAVQMCNTTSLQSRACGPRQQPYNCKQRRASAAERHSEFMFLLPAGFTDLNIIKIEMKDSQ